MSSSKGEGKKEIWQWGAFMRSIIRYAETAMNNYDI